MDCIQENRGTINGAPFYILPVDESVPLIGGTKAFLLKHFVTGKQYLFSFRVLGVKSGCLIFQKEC